MLATALSSNASMWQADGRSNRYSAIMYQSSKQEISFIRLRWSHPLTNVVLSVKSAPLFDFLWAVNYFLAVNSVTKKFRLLALLKFLAL
jgi:hypothetical protein